MGKRTLIEGLHVVAGLIAAWAVTAASAWAYPLGWRVIWWCGAAGALATLLMGIGPLRRAWAIDAGRTVGGRTK